MHSLRPIENDFQGRAGIAQSVERSLMEREVSRSTPTNAFAEIGSAAMLAAKRSAGVAPEVNFRERVMLLVHLRQVRIRQNPLWLWNPEETSPEVQSRGISGPTKGLMSSKNLKKKKKKENDFQLF